MDRYQRVEKPKAETAINENEIRITTQGRMRNYITYATTLLQVLRLSLSRSNNISFIFRFIYKQSASNLELIFVSRLFSMFV